MWWIGEQAADEPLMDGIRASVQSAFGAPTRLVRDPQRPTDTLDARRGQHASTAVLRWLKRVWPADAGAVVGVTDVDLFIPVLTFVFGEATLGGGLAVVSAARLAAAPGQAADRRLLLHRLAKECVHELGHGFGLIHCVDPGCVMARSASLVHVDTKGGALCHDCRIRFREFTRGEGGGSHGR